MIENYSRELESLKKSYTQSYKNTRDLITEMNEVKKSVVEEINQLGLRNINIKVKAVENYIKLATTVLQAEKQIGDLKEKEVKISISTLEKVDKKIREIEPDEENINDFDPAAHVLEVKNSLLKT